METTINLVPGQIIYDITESRVRHYNYLCVHPTGKGTYHILIDECQEPFRIYCERLVKILDKNLDSYRSAKNALADSMESNAKRLREEKP